MELIREVFLLTTSQSRAVKELVDHQRLISILAYRIVHCFVCLNRVQQQPTRLSLCRSLCRHCHWKCLVLSLLVSCCLAALAWCKLSLDDVGGRHAGLVSACDDSYVYIPVAFVLMMYVVYLVECWHCRLRAELDDRVDAGTVYELIRQLTDSTPIVWWRAICYHYVRRTRQVARYRNGDAFSSTQVLRHMSLCGPPLKVGGLA